MSRTSGRSFVLALALSVSMLPLRAAAGAPTLVLPLRSVGVSDTTVNVVNELMRGELEARGIAVVPGSQTPGLGPGAGVDACDDPACAAAALTDAGASCVVFGSLSRLGDKIIVRVRALRAGESSPYFADQIPALTEEDLDSVVRRAADGIAGQRPNADRATVGTVTLSETLEPRRRATRSGVGLRAGFLFPVADSYAGADRLTSIRLAWKYETPKLLIDSTSLLGFAWGDGNVDWTILDVFAARIFGAGDFAPYLGGGLGVHSVHVERERRVDNDPYSYLQIDEQSETTLTADAGVGLLALRTYDFVIVLDVRFHYVFADFEDVGGDGASGIAVTFGTSR